MMKQLQTTATNAIMDIELGFIPTRVVITNRTSLATLEWNENLPAGNFYKVVAAGTRTLETSGGITLIDGSDKSDNLDKSFGFVLPVIADINDAAEILDIEVHRNEG